MVNDYVILHKADMVNDYAIFSKVVTLNDMNVTATTFICITCCFKAGGIDLGALELG